MRKVSKAQLRLVPEQGNDAHASEVICLINTLDKQVDDKLVEITAAAAEAVFQLKNEFGRQLLHMPKKTRELPLSQFRKQYPEDFQTAAIAEIGEKFATLQHELVKQLPQATGRATRTSTKRAAEPETVLRTTRRRAAVQAQAVVVNDGCLASYTTEDASECRGKPKSDYLGRPLQTPMPFAGDAIPAAVTLLTQKRGGKTRGASETDAAVITTSDGQQWAIGKQGLSSIPVSHRNEVQELLTAQFEFFAAALGKTVFARARR